MPHPGEVLGDRYRLDDRIAAGGMGEVWRATDTVLGRDVAVKTLHAGRAGDAGFQTRFRHEARTMAVLHHPGVADVYDYGQNGPDAYIVMARVNGQALNERIAAAGRLTAAETMSIVTQAGRALEAAHRAGIVHRDVKPGNLIIQPDGTVVLVDFGVARSAESAALTDAREVVGTALYIAPEQVSKENTGPSADVYALGTVAYHCLAGYPPFLGDNAIAVAMQHVQDEPPPLPPDVPPAVRDVVTRAMAKKPDDRFPSAAAMARAADQALGSAGDTTAILAAAPASPLRTTAGSGTAILPAITPERRKKRTMLLAALVAVVLGTALAVVVAMNPAGIFPGSTPPANSASVLPSNAPSTKVSTSKSNNRGNSNRGPGRSTTGPAPSANPTEPEPSATPTGGQDTTTAPAQPTTPAQTEDTAPATGDSDTGGDDAQGAAATPTAG